MSDFVVKSQSKTHTVNTRPELSGRLDVQFYMCNSKRKTPPILGHTYMWMSVCMLATSVVIIYTDTVYDHTI